MKIALLIDTWFPIIGGGQINALEISKRIANKGIKIDILTRNLKGTSHIKSKNLKIIKIGRETDDNAISKITFVIKTLKFILKNDYDLVHAHAFLPGLTLGAYSLFKKSPTLFTVHGTSIDSHLNGFFSTLLEKIILTKIKYSAQITVSRDFLRIKNVNKRLFYIPNGVYTAPFDNLKVEKFKNTTLLFVGRLHMQKNITNLVVAFANILDKYPKLELLIVGDGPEKESINSQIRELKLKTNIKLLGQLSGKDLITVYKRSHLFILPSIYEGQSLAILEAWSARLPVVVSSGGDNKYLIKNGINGFLINNVKEPEEIKKVIISALNSKNLTKIGERGYNSVKEFMWDKAASETTRVYETLTKTSN